MPKAWKEKKKDPTRRQQGVPKNATMVVLTKLRSKPCDWCEVQGQPCMPRTKGRQQLEACEEFFAGKVSCRTAGRGGRKKRSVEEKYAKKLGESSESDEEGDE